MKKITFAFIFFVGLRAWALSDIEISGEVDATAEVYTLPTADQGNSAFRIPTLLLDINVPLKDGNQLIVSFEGAESSSNEEASRFEVQTREAYFDLVSIFDGMYALRGGLLPQPWQEAEYEDWNYRFLGETAWVITEKWKYLSYSDLGLSFMGELPNEWGETAFSIVNGEGRDAKEVGPHKEAALFVRLMKWNPWTISLNYVRGNYDIYGDEVGLKERAQALITYRGEASWWAGVEVLYAKDPADAVRVLQMAAGVDVLDLTGRAVEALGGSAFVTIGTGEKSELMLRYDYLNAVTSESGKNLSTGILAWAYAISEDLRVAAETDYTVYGDRYFAFGGRDQAKFEFAAQVLF